MNEIDAQAADWAARFDGAAPAAADEAALEAWLAADVRHVGAFARAQAVLVAYGDQMRHAADQAPSDRLQPRRPVQRPDRRRLLWGGGMAAGLAAVGVVGGWLSSAETAYATTRGERRSIALKGGGALTLNTLTDVRVHEGFTGSRVRFVEGEVLIRTSRTKVDVAFADGRLSSDRAVFGLKAVPQGVLLTVFSGAVSVSGLAGAMTPGERLRFTPAGPKILPSIDPSERARTLAWTEGRIAFEGETIASAVAEFARYSDVRIVLNDPAIGRRRITGLFATDNPAAFARALAVTSGLDLTTRDGRLYLSEHRG
jgi:transmembrane sensor